MAKGIERKSDPVLLDTVAALRSAGRDGAPIWRDIASRLAGPSRHWAQVNVGKVAQHLRDGENAVVPGKLLGSGELGKAVTVVAWNASASAQAKVAAAGGKVLTLSEGAKAFPKGEKCRIIG